MLRQFLIFAIALLVISSSTFAQSEKSAVFPSDSPDPAITKCKDGSGYYVFTTGRGIRMFHSNDLIEWKNIGQVFKENAPKWTQEAIPGARNIWAPDIAYFNGKYHLYYSVSTFGSQRSVLGLVTNKTLDPKSPDYKWEDEGLVLESDVNGFDYNAIDSALFVDKDSKTYLYWGSYWTGLKAVEVDPKTGKPFAYDENGKLKKPTNYVSIAARDPKGGNTAIEAAFVIRHEDKYYLFVSWDSCCDGVNSTYKIAIGRSDAPLGPFIDKEDKKLSEGGGTLILESDERWKGTGHNSFLQTEDGDYLVYASYDARVPRRGRLTQIRSVSWDKDGWPVVGGILTKKAE